MVSAVAKFLLSLSARSTASKTLEPHNKKVYHGLNKSCHETTKFNARSNRGPLQFESTATFVKAQPIDRNSFSRLTNQYLMNAPLQFSLTALLVLITMLAICYAVTPSVRTYIAMQSLSNADLTVDGNWIGLDVRISGKSAAYLTDLGTDTNSKLTDALADENKFAAAHVLLTCINLTEYPINGSQWNHMLVAIHADGTFNFYSEQIPELIGYWNGVLQD